MIYFAQLPTGSIKIGETDNFGRRITLLERHYGAPLVLLATMPGGRDEEDEIHGRFKHLRIGRTEQFLPGPDLMEFIGKPLFASANPETVEAKLPAGLPVRIDPDVVGKARMVAMRRNLDLGPYLSKLLEGPVDRDYAAVLRELAALEGGGK